MDSFDDQGNVNPPFFIYYGINDAPAEGGFGYFAVNPWTGDVWALWGCHKLSTPALRKSQAAIRRHFGRNELKQYPDRVASSPNASSRTDPSTAEKAPTMPAASPQQFAGVAQLSPRGKYEQAARLIFTCPHIDLQLHNLMSKQRRLRHHFGAPNGQTRKLIGNSGKSIQSWRVIRKTAAKRRLFAFHGSTAEGHVARSRQARVPSRQ
ncbi:MAG: hypothetical protein WB678_04145 [Stellaceae bacterium]